MSRLPKLWFDVEDLFDFAERNARPTGIQRVAYEVYRGALAEPSLKGRIGFLRHASHERGFIEADWNVLENRFSEVTDRPPTFVSSPTETVPGPADGLSKSQSTVVEMSDPVRPIGDRADIVRRIARAGFLFGVMQGQAGIALAATVRLTAAHGYRQAATGAVREGLNRASRIRQAWRQSSGGPTIEAKADPIKTLAAVAQRGDVLVVLGSPWFDVDYSELASHARGRLGLRLAVLVHDVIPVRRPEWVDRGTVRVYRNWYSSVLPLADLVVANSHFTASDLEAWCARDNISLSAPVLTLPIGTGFGSEAASSGAGRVPVSLPLLHAVGRRPYVLFVSTIEARKNHMLLFRVWRRLLEEMPEGTVPDLVFAGRVGWMVDDLMNQIENSRRLDGYLHIVQGLDDAGIRAAYAGCMFTVFPSYYEGWGLPVSESLSMGQPCICSNATSLPEAGGALARYFDPFDLNDATRVIRDAIEDEAGLAAWRAKVRQEFQPVHWRETALALAEAVDALE